MEKIRPLFLFYFGGSVTCLIMGISDIYHTSSLALATFMWQIINAVVLIYYFYWYDVRNTLKGHVKRSKSNLNQHDIHMILTKMLTEEIKEESLIDLNKLKERLSYHIKEHERWQGDLEENERELD